TPYQSVIGVFMLLQNLLEGIGLFLVTLALMKLRIISLRLMCYGYLLILLADSSIRYRVIIEQYIPLNTFEVLWVLGLAFFALSSIMRLSESRLIGLQELRNISAACKYMCNKIGEAMPHQCDSTVEIQRMVRFVLKDSAYQQEDLAELLGITLTDEDDFH